MLCNPTSARPENHVDTVTSVRRRNLVDPASDDGNPATDGTRTRGSSSAGGASQGLPRRMTFGDRVRAALLRTTDRGKGVGKGDPRGSMGVQACGPLQAKTLHEDVLLAEQERLHGLAWDDDEDELSRSRSPEPSSEPRPSSVLSRSASYLGFKRAEASQGGGGAGGCGQEGVSKERQGRKGKGKGKGKGRRTGDGGEQQANSAVEQQAPFNTHRIQAVDPEQVIRSPRGLREYPLPYLEKLPAFPTILSPRGSGLRRGRLYYLPTAVNGMTVLTKVGKNTWRADKTALQESTRGLSEIANQNAPGLQFRKSPRADDYVVNKSAVLRWGEEVVGADAGDGWVKCLIQESWLENDAPPARWRKPFASGEEAPSSRWEGKTLPADAFLSQDQSPQATAASEESLRQQEQDNGLSWEDGEEEAQASEVQQGKESTGALQKESLFNSVGSRLQAASELLPTAQTVRTRLEAASSSSLEAARSIAARGAAAVRQQGVHDQPPASEATSEVKTTAPVSQESAEQSSKPGPDANDIVDPEQRARVRQLRKFFGDLALLAMFMRAWRRVAQQLFHDMTREQAMSEVKENGCRLRKLDERWRQDPEIALAAVARKPKALEYFVPTGEARAVETLNRSPRTSTTDVPTYAIVKANADSVGSAFGMGVQDLAVNIAAVTKDPMALEFASEKHRANAKVVLAAVEQNGMALKYAAADIRQDPVMVKQAVEKNGEALQFADPILQNNRGIVEAAVKQNGMALQFASMELRADSAIVMKAVRQDGMALEFASEVVRARHDVVEMAVRKSPHALEHSPLTKDYKEIEMLAFEIHPGSLKFAHRDTVIRLLKRDGNNLEHIGHYKDDMELVRLALARSQEAVAKITSKSILLTVLGEDHPVRNGNLYGKLFDSDFRFDPDVVFTALRSRGMALQHCPEELRKTDPKLFREMVLTAVKQSGMALKFASHELLRDPEVVYAAVKQNVEAYKWLVMFHPREKEKWGNDIELTKIVLAQQGDLLECVSPELKKDKDLVKQALTHNGLALKFAPHHLRDDCEVVAVAIKQNREALSLAKRKAVLALIREDSTLFPFAPEELKEDFEIVATAVAQDPDLFHLAGANVRRNAGKLKMFTKRVTQCQPAIADRQGTAVA